MSPLYFGTNRQQELCYTVVGIDIVYINGLGRDCLERNYSRCVGHLNTFTGISIVRITRRHYNSSPSTSRVRGILRGRNRQVVTGVPGNTTIIPLYVRNDRFSSPLLTRGVRRVKVDGSSITFVVNNSFKLSPRIGRLNGVGLSFNGVALPRRLTHLILLRRICETFSVGGGSGCRG